MPKDVVFTTLIQYTAVTMSPISRVIRTSHRHVLLFVFFGAFCSFFFGVCAAFAAEDVGQERIRVAVVRSERLMAVLPEDALLRDHDGRQITWSGPMLTLAVDGDQVVIAGERFRRLALYSPAVVRMNGKGYRGAFDISVQQGKVLVVNELPLEDYLVGVITSEISSSWPPEAIKAQAVIARTYALTKKRERSMGPYHLEATVMDQVYNGVDRDDDKARQGVRDTHAQVLLHNGKTIQAFYHANSGGRTESARNVFGADIPYLQGVECMYGLMSPGSRWEWQVTRDRLASQLRAQGLLFTELFDIVPGTFNDRGRRSTVSLETDRGSIVLPATKFRMLAGSTLIKSTNFNVARDGERFTFVGAGYGHGVGLCQYGMKQRALDGFSYTEILSYYYPGTVLAHYGQGDAVQVP